VLSPLDEVQAGQCYGKIIGSPGHDPMSVVLYQPDLKLLISADALWENGFGVVFLSGKAKMPRGGLLNSTHCPY